jgi:hypothetical protein
LASGNGHTETAAALLAVALHRASGAGETETVMALVAAGADVHSKDNEGYGSGLELHGPVDVDTFIDALRRVDEARHAPPFGDSFGLQQPAGMVMPGFGGKPIPVPTVDRLGGASISAFNLHGWSGPESWPYKSSDFSRLDEKDDALKYAAPNFGHHIDAPARAALSATYAVFFDSANPRRIGGSERRANLEPKAPLHQGISQRSNLVFDGLEADDLGEARLEIEG